MKTLITFITIFLFINSFAEEENIVSKTNYIPPEVQKQLGIKTEKVIKKSIKITKKYPAVVKDDLTLSQAVYSPVNGIIKKLFVKEGDKVRKNQKLAYIYSPEIAMILTQIKQAQVQVKTSKELFQREKQLYEEKITTYTRFFQAKINYENALARLKALEESLNIYGELENNFLVLKSQIEGYIAKQNVILGDSVNIEKLMFKIHSHEILWAVAYVPVVEIKNIKTKTKAEVISPLGKTKGIIDFISHKVDPKTKRVEVRIIADNKNEVLKPEMFVDVKIPFKHIYGIIIPASAVVLQGDKYFVFVKEQDKFYPREIEVQQRIDGFYLVKSGLKEGEIIVTDGTIHLKARFFAEAEE
ncbi:MAG: efflux RND transporter periplasmic adaptor subunit [Aquificae bacterium]|nr:efflux RND transporter periplasmic adaptor subunit [Aquificota bacterium]